MLVRLGYYMSGFNAFGVLPPIIANLIITQANELITTQSGDFIEWR